MDMESADLLVDILRHLPPRSLANARCVCKAWRATIDDHRLLRASQLPLSLDGVIFETEDPNPPMLFSRRSTARKITSGLEYLDDSPGPGEKEWYWPMFDCCNGLLLLYRHVVNPATHEWVRLPTPPRSCMATDCDHHQNRYLVYDPAVSPHYEVFLVPQIPCTLPVEHIARHTYAGESASAMEWPPSTYIVHAFSSKTGRWKERSLVREGDAAGTVADIEVASSLLNYLYYSAYWQGALYARCECGFVLRISLADDKYQVIKLPRGNKGLPRLGKSKKGVYCALLHRQQSTCEIWFLDESHGHMEWALRNEINLQPIHTYYLSVHSDDGSWILQPHGQKEWSSTNDTNIELVEDDKETLPEDDFEWDSTDENMVATTELPRDGDHGGPHFECLGFHPYKEIVLLHWSNQTIGYYFDSSKVRYLGKMTHSCTEIELSFAYAPCWTMGLPGSI